MKRYEWRNYRGPLIFGGILVVMIALINGLFRCEKALDVMRVLCDAFSIGGGILLCIGGLCWVSSTGMFDGLIYSTRQFGQVFKPADQRSEETYDEYVRRKKEHPVLIRTYLIPGVLYFAIGMIFLGAFYCLY